METLVDELSKTVEAMCERGVNIGIIDNAPPNPESGVPLIEYATLQEFGRDDPPALPERSFLRECLNQDEEVLGRMAKGHFAKMFRSNIDIKRANEEVKKGKTEKFFKLSNTSSLNKLAEESSDVFEAFIADNRVKPPSRSPTTLIDTAHLIEHIEGYVVSAREGEGE